MSRYLQLKDLDGEMLTVPNVPEINGHSARYVKYKGIPFKYMGDGTYHQLPVRGKYVGTNKYLQWYDFTKPAKEFNSVPSEKKYVSVELKNTLKEGAEIVFSIHPQLRSIGSEQDYSKYLDTVFPSSTNKEIVFHGTDQPLSKILSEGFKNNTELYEPDDDRAFEVGELGAGYYFGKYEYVQNYGDTVVPVILNNPRIEDLSLLPFENYKEVKDKQYFVQSKKDIHILGSEKDILQFKNYMNQITVPSPITFTQEMVDTINENVKKAGYTKVYTIEELNAMSEDRKKKAIDCYGTKS